MYKHVYRVARSRYFEENADIMALDYYDKDSVGADRFSRQQVWFYLYGDSRVKEEFSDALETLFRLRFDQDSVDWDTLALVPEHVEGEVNHHLREVVRSVSSESEADYRQVLKRTDTVKQSHEVTGDREKFLNLEDSLEAVKSVKGRNVVLVDNVSNSGFSFLHAKNLLKREGAENVACMCLGLDRKKKRRGLDVEGIHEELTFSDISRKIVTGVQKSEVKANGR
jgi:hypothetical protein